MRRKNFAKLESHPIIEILQVTVKGPSHNMPIILYNESNFYPFLGNFEN